MSEGGRNKYKAICRNALEKESFNRSKFTPTPKALARAPT
jgi:hypothetical protein